MDSGREFQGPRNLNVVFKVLEGGLGFELAHSLVTMHPLLHGEGHLQRRAEERLSTKPGSQNRTPLDWVKGWC